MKQKQQQASKQYEDDDNSDAEEIETMKHRKRNKQNTQRQQSAYTTVHSEVNGDSTDSDSEVDLRKHCQSVERFESEK